MSVTHQDVRTLTVEPVTLVCRRSFQAVSEALEGIVPKLDQRPPELLRHAEAAEIADQRALITSEGRAKQALQIETGNPLTAQSMTGNQLDEPAWSETLACADAPCAGTERSHDWPGGDSRAGPHREGEEP